MYNEDSLLMIYWSIPYWDILPQVEILENSENLENIHQNAKSLRRSSITPREVFCNGIVDISYGSVSFSYWKTLYDYTLSMS